MAQKLVGENVGIFAGRLSAGVDPGDACPVEYMKMTKRVLHGLVGPTHGFGAASIRCPASIAMNAPAVGNHI